MEILVGIAGSFGVTGNVLAFCTFGRIGTPNASTVLLRFLAFVDSCTLLSIMFITFIDSHLCCNISWLCYIRNLFTSLNVYFISRTAAIWTPVLIGIYRYIVICRPFSAARLCTINNARKHCFCILVFSVIVHIPHFVLYDITWLMPINPCGPKGMRFGPRSLWFLIGYGHVFLFGMIEFAIPVSSLLVITVKSLLSLRSSRQRRMDMRQGQDGCQDDRGLNMMIIVVMIVFMICQTGYSIAMMLLRLGAFQELHHILMVILHICLMLNSSFNVIIYVTFNRKFRQILCRCRRVACWAKASERSTNNDSCDMGLNRMDNSW